MRLTWDDIGSRLYKIGVDRGVLYTTVDDEYQPGVAWNGLVSIEHSISGREATPLYTNDIKSRILLSPEEFGGTISAYYYPDAFEPCMGNDVILDGLIVGQQETIPFGLTYRTKIANDTEGTNFAYQIHFIYGALVTTLNNVDTTVNSTSDVSELSWTFESIPVDFEGYSPVSHMFIDSRKFNRKSMSAVEDVIWGTDESAPRLPLPDEVVRLLWEGFPYSGFPQYGVYPSGEIFPATQEEENSI